MTEMDKPYLQIETQPHEGPYRFRYESELKNENHGCIHGIQQQKGCKSSPKVSLKNFDFHSRVTIRCSLYQADNQMSPHCNSISQRIKTLRIKSPIQLEVGKENSFTAM